MTDQVLKTWVSGFRIAIKKWYLKASIIEHCSMNKACHIFVTFTDNILSKLCLIYFFADTWRSNFLNEIHHYLVLLILCWERVGFLVMKGRKKIWFFVVLEICKQFSSGPNCVLYNKNGKKVGQKFFFFLFLLGSKLEILIGFLLPSPSLSK